MNEDILSHTLYQKVALMQPKHFLPNANIIQEVDFFTFLHQFWVILC